MDTALLLRQAADAGRQLPDSQIDGMLLRSATVKRLTKGFEEDAFFAIFRLLCLAEIPYAGRLAYTQTVLSFISAHLATPQGFSYTGSVQDIVPCYNAMLLEAYSRLGLAASEEAQNALQWIKKYQVFDRNQTSGWTRDGICRHGGCMRAVPCYIGIGKTVRALLAYCEATGHTDRKAEALLDEGCGYMLRHHLFQRLSNGQPISAHITDIMFPQAYMLSLTDLVTIAQKRRLWADSRTKELKQLVQNKANSQGLWNLEYVYSHKGYRAFGSRNHPCEWITYLFDGILTG